MQTRNASGHGTLICCVIVVLLTACVAAPVTPRADGGDAARIALDDVAVDAGERADASPDAVADSDDETSVETPPDVATDTLDALSLDAPPDIATDVHDAMSSDAPLEAAMDGSDVHDAALPDTTPLHLSWRLDSPTRIIDQGTPAAIAPDGTLYVARTRVTATRRVAHDVDLDETLVAAFDTRAAMRTRVAAPSDVTVMPRGLVVDARGPYLFVRAATAWSIGTARVTPTAAQSGVVIALDPEGGVRWSLPLGAARWEDGSFLNGRSGRLVLVGIASGRVSLGALTVDASAGHLVVAEISRTGDVLALRDLGVATGALVGDVNARGDIVTLRYDASSSSTTTSWSLDRWSPDGRNVWSRGLLRAAVALDDEGRVYTASDLLCPREMVGPTQAAACVVALDDTGATRWSVRVVIDTLGYPYLADDWRHALMWQDGRLRYAASTLRRGDWTGTSGVIHHCITGTYVGATVTLDASGAGDVARPSGRILSDAPHEGSRRCTVWVSQSVPAACRGPLALSVEGGVDCEGDTAGCTGDTVSCAGACVDLTSDMHHCGACGRSCVGAFPQASGVCVDGACHFGICAAGRANCNGLVDDGCEVDVASDPGHCGACDLRCSASARCVGGRCCEGDRCAASPYASDGLAGAFAPAADVTARGDIVQATTVTIPEGVTVRAADGVLRLYAQGDVRIDGTIDLSGRAARICPGYSPGVDCPVPPPGASPGREGFLTGGVWCSVCPLWVHDERMIHPAYERGGNTAFCEGYCGGHNDTPPGSYFYGNYASNGSIGVAAVEDLPIYRVFEPGSRRGITTHASMIAPGDAPTPYVHVGGGGGGAVRIASATRIVLGPRARVLADGRDGGSGGVVVLHAPEVRVASGALVSALGVDGASYALGRVRVAVDASRCALDGTFRPPLASGCTPTPPERALAHTVVTPWPL